MCIYYYYINNKNKKFLYVHKFVIDREKLCINRASYMLFGFFSIFFFFMSHVMALIETGLILQDFVKACRLVVQVTN